MLVFPIPKLKTEHIEFNYYITIEVISPAQDTTLESMSSAVFPSDKTTLTLLLGIDKSFSDVLDHKVTP